jgi:hypothetical protein
MEEGRIPHTGQFHGAMYETKEMFPLQQTTENLSTLEETTSFLAALLKNNQCGLNCSDRYPTHSGHI